MKDGINDKNIKQKKTPQTIRFASINVNGLNFPQKRGKIFNQLIKVKTEVLCPQETHIKEKDTHLLINN